MANPLLAEVDHLLTAFPNRCPSYSLSEKDFAFLAGQIDIVDRLRLAKESGTFPIEFDHAFR